MTFDERFKEYLRREDGQLTVEEEYEKEMKQRRLEARKLKEREVKNQRAKVRHKEIEKGCCSILTEHHENLKDDPEHLTTDFLLDITGCKCNKKENNETDTTEKKD
jgi:hypothetical protein